MTLIVTHANGFLGCFTREADGTLRQRALIDTGDEPPTAVELADLGEKFANEYGWIIDNHVMAAAPQPQPAQRIAPRKAPPPLPPVRKGNYTTTDVPPPLRNAMILDYMRKHPRSTEREFHESRGVFDDPAVIARWKHKFNEMLDSGELLSDLEPRNINGTGVSARVYWLPPVRPTTFAESIAEAEAAEAAEAD